MLKLFSTLSCLFHLFQSLDNSWDLFACSSFSLLSAWRHCLRKQKNCAEILGVCSLDLSSSRSFSSPAFCHSNSSIFCTSKPNEDVFVVAHRGWNRNPHHSPPVLFRAPTLPRHLEWELRTSNCRWYSRIWARRLSARLAFSSLSDLISSCTACSSISKVSRSPALLSAVELSTVLHRFGMTMSGWPQRQPSNFMRNQWEINEKWFQSWEIKLRVEKPASQPSSAVSSRLTCTPTTFQDSSRGFRANACVVSGSSTSSSETSPLKKGLKVQGLAFRWLEVPHPMWQQVLLGSSAT